MTTQTIDHVHYLEGALVQHGPLNDRVYVMKMPIDASAEVVSRAVVTLARDQNYSKIFAKIPSVHESAFLKAGFAVEARVPGYFGGEVDGLFLGRYFSSARAVATDADELDNVLEIARSKSNTPIKDLADRFVLRACTPEDTVRMAHIYSIVFPTYPFPIDDPDYLAKTMADDEVLYFGIERDGQLIALSSGEMDKSASSVEMTDFATLPDHRGHGFAVHLLKRMEAELVRRGFHTAFTIARAASPGMNVTFSKAGYGYGGRLINNTNISGRIESMNVWYQPLS